MSIDTTISVIDLPKSTGENKNGPNEDMRKKPADFETAVAAAGYGKYQRFLLLSIIPVSWASNFDTANMSLILPSAECDLQLTLFHKGVLNAITYVGMVLSGFLWGYIADVRGRKSLVIYGYLADGICNLLLGFSQDFWMLVCLKFLSGFIVSGPYASLMAYCSEFYGVKERTKVPLLVGFSVGFGCIVNAALAWMVIPQDWSIVLWDGAFVYNSWRIFLSLCSLPTILGVACVAFFPESPKFLMSQGRTEEALKVFKSMYSWNTGKSADDYPIRDLEDETIKQTTKVSVEANSKGGFQAGMSQMKTIFFYPHLPRLLLVIVLQFGGMLAMNTVRLWQPQLFTILDNFDITEHNSTLEREPTFCEILDFTTVTGDTDTVIEMSDGSPICTNLVVADSIYINNIIISATTNLCILAASFTLSILDHKKLLFIGYGISALCLISLYWASDLMIILVLICLFVGLMSTTLNIVIGAAVILFPTSLRTMAVSMEMVFGRIGSMLGNLLFPILLAFGCIAPMIALATFTCLCFVLTYFLPMNKKIKE